MDVTFKPIAEIALSWGVKPNTLRVWRQRAIPYRYQLKLLQHFGQSFTITDWSPDIMASVEKPSIATTWFKKQRERQLASQNDGASA
jgi:transposase-like protein